MVKVWSAPALTVTDPDGLIEPFAPALALMVNVWGGMSEGVAEAMSGGVAEGMSESVAEAMSGGVSGRMSGGESAGVSGGVLGAAGRHVPAGGSLVLDPHPIRLKMTPARAKLTPR